LHHVLLRARVELSSRREIHKRCNSFLQDKPAGDLCPLNWIPRRLQQADSAQTARREKIRGLGVDKKRWSRISRRKGSRERRRSAPLRDQVVACVSDLWRPKRQNACGSDAMRWDLLFVNRTCCLIGTSMIGIALHKGTKALILDVRRNGGGATRPRVTGVKSCP